MSETTTATLYDRLGRRDGITRITRELIKNHLANPIVSNRYRQIKDMDRLPAAMSASWLVTEKAGHTVRFVESAYRTQESETWIRSVFAGCTRVEATPMSLREIFLTLARTYRLTSSEEMR